MITIWVLGCSFSLVKTLHITLTYNAEQDVYYCESLLSENSEKIYTIFKWILAFLVPYSLIVIVSVLLLKFLKEWSDNAKKMATRNANRPIESSDNQSNKSALKSLALYELIKKKTQCKQETLLSIDDQVHPQPLSDTITPRPKRKSNKSLHNKIKRKSTKFVLFVVFSFLCAWLPLWTFHIVMLFTEQHSLLLALMNNLTLVIVYMQGVIDPLLYLFLTENFKKLIQNNKRLLCRC
jgi:hypothetical protein